MPESSSFYNTREHSTRTRTKAVVCYLATRLAILANTTCSYILSAYILCALLAYTYSAFSAIRIGKLGHSQQLKLFIRPLLAAKSDPPDQFWLPNLALLGQLAIFGNQKWSGGDLFWWPKLSWGTTFGQFQFSHDRSAAYCELFFALGKSQSCIWFLKTKLLLGRGQVQTWHKTSNM